MCVKILAISRGTVFSIILGMLNEPEALLLFKDLMILNTSEEWIGLKKKEFWQRLFKKLSNLTLVFGTLDRIFSATEVK